jgi:hypothetical protein
MKDDSLWVDAGVDDLANIAPASCVSDEHFIGCPVWWLQRVLPVVKGNQIVVALYLWRRRIVCGNRKTFSVPNGELKSWGISRKTKYQALDRLTAAGMIRTNRKGKEALTVTILLKKPRSNQQ